ncbi:DUF3992 domain-containing protein [Paenibacillus paeoniae]|uniref:DUF3992 domain-containing protein n=1 Tax=Paenibacillus paeoniae TaxID=2292705 RepID=A0A371PGU3_9BACL|nr:S-Ena type endospore appendage [Paenibacillus paeoniae]REK75173.1 DUF3992 domain-containing protein [Paenibacillus paeoniae]
MGCKSSSSSLYCCPDRKYVQDKVCNPWNGSGAAANDVVVYSNNINRNIVGTGYLQYNTGPANITLEILDSAGTALETFILSPGQSTSFTSRRFTSIQVAIPATAGDYQGEFCITTRYPVA